MTKSPTGVQVPCLDHIVKVNGWSLTIRVDGQYERYDVDRARTTADQDQVSIYFKIQKRPSSLSTKPDAHVSIGRTPKGRRIYKIESLHRHIVTEAGPQQQLQITIQTTKGTEGELEDQVTKNSASRFDFAWQLEPCDIESVLQPPKGVLTYGACLIFMASHPHEAALSNYAPTHEDNPKVVLHRDIALQDRHGKSCRLGNMELDKEPRCWADTKEVAYDENCEKMWRLVALGWQPRGKGKGDSSS